MAFINNKKRSIDETYENGIYIFNSNLYSINYDNLIDEKFIFDGIRSINFNNKNQLYGTYHNGTYILFQKYFIDAIIKIRQIFNMNLNNVKKSHIFMTIVWCSDNDIIESITKYLYGKYENHLCKAYIDRYVDVELSQISSDSNYYRIPVNIYPKYNNVLSVSVNPGFKKITNYSLNENNKYILDDNHIKHFLKSMYNNFWFSNNPYVVGFRHESSIVIYDSYLLLNLDFKSMKIKRNFIEKLPSEVSYNEYEQLVDILKKYNNYLMFDELYGIYWSLKKLFNNLDDNFSYYDINELCNIDNELEMLDEDFYDEGSKFYTNPKYNYIHKGIEKLVSEALNNIKLYNLIII